MSRRMVLVVNPQSQQGALGKRWPDLSSRLRRTLGSFDEVFTEAAGDGTRLARAALESGADTVVAIGGDGTINEVINGFFDDGVAVAPESALGILPFGTGGDFRKTVRVPKDLDRSADILAAGETRRIDLGQLDYTRDDGSAGRRLFANIASFGISGVVDDLVNKGSKRLGGKVSFFLATARATWGWENQRVRLVFDGDEAGGVDMTIHTVAVANGQYFGGGMRIAPDAELGDGQFDVVALGDFSRAEIMWQGRRIYSGTHLELDKVSCRRARTIRAESVDGSDVLLDVDGETPGRLPATFTLLPSALRVVMPPA